MWIIIVGSIIGLGLAYGLVLLKVFILAVVACVISGVITFTTLEYGADDEDHKAAKRIFKRCFIPAVVVAVAIILIPTKNTLLEMQIARYATYENAEITVDAIKSAVDYIVDAMKSVK